MPYNSWADVCQLMAERYDTKSNINLVGFDPSVKCPTSQTTWRYNETVCGWQYIYIYIHTHTWINIYIYIYICSTVFSLMLNSNKPGILNLLFSLSLSLSLSLTNWNRVIQTFWISPSTSMYNIDIIILEI